MFEIICACALLYTAKTHIHTHTHKHTQTHTHPIDMVKCLVFRQACQKKDIYSFISQVSLYVIIV